ncbi:hypothetical protein D3C85_1653500 [compost metagenome]
MLLQAQGGSAAEAPAIDLALQAVSAQEYAAAGVRLMLGVPDLARVLAWRKPEAGLAGGAALSIRAALGLGASREVAQASTPVFGAPSEAALV